MSEAVARRFAPRWYSKINGIAEGSIIATIITVQDVSMEKLGEAVIACLRRQATLLEEPRQVGESYVKRCGSLAIETGTGMREVITVNVLKNLVPIRYM